MVVRTNISIEEDLLKTVDSYCDKTGLSRSSYIQKLLQEDQAKPEPNAVNLLLSILKPENKVLIQDVASLKEMTIEEYLNDVFNKILVAMVKKYQ